jgi:hypothetical protein
LRNLAANPDYSRNEPQGAEIAEGLLKISGTIKTLRVLGVLCLFCGRAQMGDGDHLPIKKRNR